jgi:hypothetical protein
MSTSTTSTPSTPSTLDLICFSDKLRDVEQKIISGKESRTEILPLSLIADKQKITLPNSLKNEPFYLISKNDDKFFISSFRVYANDDNTLAICNCFNMPVTGISIDSLMIGSNYQLQSYAKCSIDSLIVLIPIWHSSLSDTSFVFGDNPYLEVATGDTPSDFVKGVNRINYINCVKLPLKKTFEIVDTVTINIESDARKSNHDYLLKCTLNGCTWLIKPNKELLTQYSLNKIKSFSLVEVTANKRKRDGNDYIEYTPKFVFN